MTGYDPDPRHERSNRGVLHGAAPPSANIVVLRHHPCIEGEEQT
jgi:hypothetical protein